MSQKSQPSPDPLVDSLVARKYKGPEAEVAVKELDQGEKDILEQVRQALGWPSIKSLAVKYYPSYRNRKWWMEALRRTLHYAAKWKRRRIINIRYLLRTLASIAAEKAALAKAKNSADNRLTASGIFTEIGVSNRYGETNRLTATLRSKLRGPARYLSGKYGHLIQGGECWRAQGGQEAAC